MWFTWMMAMQMWTQANPDADPFRMAEESTAKMLDLHVPGETGSTLPRDKGLVA